RGRTLGLVLGGAFVAGLVLSQVPVLRLLRFTASLARAGATAAGTVAALGGMAATGEALRERPRRLRRAARRATGHRRRGRTTGVPMSTRVAEVDERRILFANTETLLWPEANISKGDLIDYYVELADVVLPFLAQRPLSLLRCPDGVAGECVYQKMAPPGLP